MTYSSNKDANMVMIDAQKLDELKALIEQLHTEIEERDAIIARQRVIIELYNDSHSDMDAWHAAQDTSTMTGTTEQ